MTAWELRGKAPARSPDEPGWFCELLSHSWPLLCFGKHVKPSIPRLSTEHFASRTSPCHPLDNGSLMIYLKYACKQFKLTETENRVHYLKLKNITQSRVEQNLEVYNKTCLKCIISDYLANLIQHPVKCLPHSALFTNNLQPPTNTKYRSRHVTNVAYTTKTSCSACFVLSCGNTCLIWSTGHLFQTGYLFMCAWYLILSYYVTLTV